MNVSARNEVQYCNERNKRRRRRRSLVSPEAAVASPPIVVAEETILELNNVASLRGRRLMIEHGKRRWHIYCTIADARGVLLHHLSKDYIKEECNDDATSVVDDCYLIIRV